jgi:hypothetical protein
MATELNMQQAMCIGIGMNFTDSANAAA